MLSSKHDIYNIMLDYSDGVWPREMMKTMMYIDAKMLSDDIDSDDDALSFIYVIKR
jgi:hypothetical protein